MKSVVLHSESSGTVCGKECYVFLEMFPDNIRIDIKVLGDKCYKFGNGEVIITELGYIVMFSCRY